MKGNALQLLLRVAVAVLGLALIYGTAAPLLHSNAWWIRLFDFPRIQIAGLLALTLAAYALMRCARRLRLWEYALAATVGLALIWQLAAIAPYTSFYPKQMLDSRAEDGSNRVSLLIYNVLHDNRQVDALIEAVRDSNPDIILLSETTQWWLEQLDGLAQDYPYTVAQPQDNHYGMLLYSRLELQDPRIRFLIEPSIPSIRTQVRLRSGTLVTLYGVHPRPPGLEEDGRAQDDEREDTDMRDAELLAVAQEVRRQADAPVIVAGDFNDVAWSRTTHHFQRVGGLLDPRVGRGLLNTFDTKSRLLRYPLDHVFASRHFFLVELRRLPDIGSDHFPMLVILDYDPDASVTHEAPQPEPGDHREADQAVDTATDDD